MAVPNELTLNSILTLLQQVNTTQDILWLITLAIIFWILFSSVLILFLPRKYKKHKKEIFLFFIVINIGLLFMGVLLTILMVLFGLSWATHRVSRPHYEMVYFEEQASEFPIVYSEFHEGLLSVEDYYKGKTSNNEKIKSLKIIYDSNAQGNIGKIQKFLADSSDETRLYAFALVSQFEKRLNHEIKKLQKQINDASSSEHREKKSFELAQTYWQFIYHDVAGKQLTGLYTQKIEDILSTINNNSSALILLGKINIFNKESDLAEKHFQEAIGYSDFILISHLNLNISFP